MSLQTKKKVLIVHNYYQLPGGEDTVVANEKKLLEDNGHEVILYTRHNNEIKTMPNWKKLGVAVMTIFNVHTYRDIVRIIRQENIEIVHVHNTLNLISAAVYYAARKCGVPVVQTVHNFRLLCPGATFYRKGAVCEKCLHKGIGCAIVHGCYRNSRLQTLVCVMNLWIHRLTGIYRKINYICLTEFNKEKLLQLKGIREEQIYVKPNFVEEEAEYPATQERKDQFVFLARLDKFKGIDVLLEAWRIMGENAPKLLVCGTGPMEEWCKEFIAAHHLQQIEMMGLVSNDKAREILAQSKALVLPTQLYEGFPVSIVEAFSAGTPVVCSDIGNTGSIVEEGKTGCKFQPDDPQALCDAVRRVYQIPDAFQKVRDTYLQHYSSRKNYTLLNECYEQVCSKNQLVGSSAAILQKKQQENSIKKQNVLIVHNYYQLPGGEDTVVANEKELLQANGHKVFLYTRHNSELRGFSLIQKLMLPLSTVFSIRTYREIRKRIKANQIDVVHVHNTLNMISPSVYYAALSCRIPVVQTLHNFRMLCPGANFFRDGKICEDCVSKGIGCAVLHKCYRGSALQTLGVVISTLFHRMTGIYRKIYYICLTDFNRNKLLELNKSRRKPVVDPKKVYVKPNFTFDSGISPQPGENYLAIGRVEQLKGIDVLLEAFRKMPEKKLAIAGSGKEMESYRAKASRNVTFLGQLDKQQLLVQLGHSKAVIAASQAYESFGMSIAEAYAAHKPVIAGNIGNIGALAEDQVTGIKFQYDSADALVEAVGRFEQADAATLGEQGYQKFQREFAPEANYRLLKQIYDESV